MNSQQLAVISVLMGVVLVFSGCEGFRYAATEAQKENVWLHTQVCSAAADAAVEESASQELCGLTALAQEQSTAFVADYGLPENPSGLKAISPWQGRSLMGSGFAAADLNRSLDCARDNNGGELSDSEAGSFGHNGGEFNTVLSQAKADSLKKPDVFELADGVIDLGIAIAGLVGGVYGIRIAGYLKTARDKSKALKEIVEGNELFKQLWPEQAERFKEVQQKQSAATKQIVTQLKAG